MDMLKLKMTKAIQTHISVGSVSLRAKLSGLKLRLMSLFIILIFVNNCSEFALITSAGSLAASQNAYAKTYSAIDFGVVITTDQSIKTHAYQKTKEIINDKKRILETISPKTRGDTKEKEIFEGI